MAGFGRYSTCRGVRAAQLRQGLVQRAMSPVAGSRQSQDLMAVDHASPPGAAEHAFLGRAGAMGEPWENTVAWLQRIAPKRVVPVSTGDPRWAFAATLLRSLDGLDRPRVQLRSPAETIPPASGGLPVVVGPEQLGDGVTSLGSILKRTTHRLGTRAQRSPGRVLPVDYPGRRRLISTTPPVPVDVWAAPIRRLSRRSVSCSCAPSKRWP
jgi:hypothetical protein